MNSTADELRALYQTVYTADDDEPLFAFVRAVVATCPSPSWDDRARYAARHTAEVEKGRPRWVPTGEGLRHTYERACAHRATGRPS